MRHRRLFARALAAGLASAALLLPAGIAAVPAAAAPSGSKNVIVQLFEWNWPSVASECTSFLGPHGYGYVQVSPPQEHATGQQWWVAYQPVSYRIESRKGTRAQFQSMVTTCHNAGVQVIVDAVINHMTGVGAGSGWAGSTYTAYTYPGIYQTQDFHHCGRNGTDDIVNYNDRYEVQNCELVNLADLKTESDYVRTKIASYLNDLLTLGVDGFRLDASKHMAAADIAAIKSKLSRSVYLVQEVIYGSGEPVLPTEYTGNGDVHEFRYGKDLGRVFRSEKLAYLNNFGEPWGYLPTAKAAVFVDNHDTQREGGTVLTYKDNGIYALANAFMLAWPYGSPTVMSSYDFTDKDAGPPSSAAGKTNNTVCYSGWRCEHRWTAIDNMVGFHNAVQGTSVVNWYDNGNNHIAFGRNGKGYLSINDEDGAINGRQYHSNVPAGRYCDVIHGSKSGATTCTGPVITVDAAGWFSANIAAHDAVAIHTGAKIG